MNLAGNTCNDDDDAVAGAAEQWQPLECACIS
jgi:hypothetical protein